MDIKFSCRDVTSRVMEALDGHLNSGEKHAFYKHLCDCEECMNYYRNEMKFKVLIKDSVDDYYAKRLKQEMISELRMKIRNIFKSP